jgi:hypothetical protein
MEVANLGPLPREATVLLYCSPTKFEKDGDNYRCLATGAFKHDDDGISVTWIEYFQSPPPSVEQAKQAIVASLNLNKNGVYAKAKVSEIFKLANKAKISVSVVHDPQCRNHGHSLIKGWPLDDAIRQILTKAFPPPAERVGE